MKQTHKSDRDILLYTIKTTTTMTTTSTSTSTSTASEYHATTNQGSFSVTSSSSSDDDDDDDVTEFILRTPTAPSSSSVALASAAAAAAGSINMALSSRSSKNKYSSKISFDEDDDSSIKDSSEHLVGSVKAKGEIMYFKDEVVTVPGVDVNVNVAEMEIHLMKLKLGHLTNQNRTLFYRNEKLEKKLRDYKNDQDALDLWKSQGDSVRLEVIRGDQLHSAHREMEAAREEAGFIRLQLDEVKQKSEHDALLSKTQQQEIQRLSELLSQRSVVESDAARRLKGLTLTSLRTEEHLVDQKLAAEVALAELRHEKEIIEAKLVKIETETIGLVQENRDLNQRLMEYENASQHYKEQLRDASHERSKLLQEIDELKSRDVRKMDNYYAVEVRKHFGTFEAVYTKSKFKISLVKTLARRTRRNKSKC